MGSKEEDGKVVVSSGNIICLELTYNNKIGCSYWFLFIINVERRSCTGSTVGSCVNSTPLAVFSVSAKESVSKLMKGLLKDIM